IEVTNECSGAFCQVFFGTLSGWVDMQYISVASNEAPATEFIYQIVAGDGTVTMLGRTQPTPVETGGKVVFRPLGERLILTMPPRLEMPPLTMERVGSNSFSGTMPDWGGFPVKVEIIAERVSHQRATLEFFANNAQVKMDMRMDLRRVGEPMLTTELSSGTSQGNVANGEDPQISGAGSVCLLAADVSASIGLEPIPYIEDAYEQILDQIEIDFRNATEAQCKEVLDASLKEGLLCEIVNRVGLPAGFVWGPVQINANGGTKNPIPAQFCRLSQPRPQRQGGNAIGQTGTENIKTVGSEATPTQPQTQRQNSQGQAGRRQDIGLCDALSIAIDPILRGSGGSNARSDLMGVLKSIGVFDLTNASAGECRQIAIDLQKTGLIIGGDIDLTAASQPDGLGGPEPMGGGEDPNTMVNGGLEIAGSEQDFAPISETSQMQGTESSSSASSSALRALPPVECIFLADQIVRILDRNNPDDIKKLQGALFVTFITDISSSNKRQCLAATADMQKQGLLQ
ncbi:MAG: hypothetical protein ABJZ69_09210, partial [Hyphomicrobiales bacterium]